MKTIILVIAALGFVASANAASGGTGLKGTGAYGVAGCGLGSMVFGNQEGAMQVIAATLNGTGMQTFGITSGTSNCGPSAFSSAEAKAFIDNNAVALENDVVRGQGETLATLSKIMKCDEAVLGTTLKNNYKSIYSSGEASAKVMETASSVCAI